LASLRGWAGLAPHGALALASLDKRAWAWFAPHGTLALALLDKRAWDLALLIAISDTSALWPEYA